MVCIGARIPRHMRKPGDRLPPTLGRVVWDWRETCLVHGPGDNGGRPPTLGRVVCDWMETYLVHGPGDIEGRPLRLTDEQRAFLWRVYELRPDGRRRYRRAVYSRRKGVAKTELAAAISCAELLGPV